MGADPQAPRGISLEHYAAIRAALAEPFPRNKVLAIEGVPAARFSPADQEWKETLASPMGKELFERFKAALADAEDWLTRTVVPLDDDLAAWIAFQTAFMKAPKPDEVLRAASLGMNDISRLTRKWDRRLQADAALQKRAADLRQRSDSPLPRITAEPRELRRSRVAPKEQLGVKESSPDVSAPAPAAPQKSASGTGDVADILGQANLPFVASGEPEQRVIDRAVASGGPISDKYPATKSGDTLDANEILQKGRPAAVPFAQREAPAPAPPKPITPPAPIAPPVIVAAMTPAASPNVTPPTPAKKAPQVTLAGTMDVSELLKGGVLPFTTTPQEKAAAAKKAAAATCDVTEILRGKALPFDEEPSEPAIALARAQAHANERQGSEPKHGRSGQTMDVGALLAGRKAEPTPPKPADTADVGALVAETKLPFQPPAEARQPTADELIQRFTLQQLASLAVDLSMGQRPHVLQRYGLTDAQGTALEAAWNKKIAADGVLRAAFYRAMSQYQAWLAQYRR